MKTQTKHTPDVLLPLVEQLRLIAKLSHKHEIQSWLDEPGSDGQKLSRIFKMSAGMATDIKELLEAAKWAVFGKNDEDRGRMSSCSGYGENGCGNCSRCALKAAIAKTEGK